MNYNDFLSLMPDFLNYLIVERRRSLHTQRAYTIDLEQFRAFWERIDRSLELKHALDRYISALYKQQLDEKSIARKLSCFSSFGKFLKAKNSDINLVLERPHILQQAPICISVEEMAQLLDSIDEELPSKYPYRDKAIIELLYATGIRSSEIVAITMNRVDMQAKTIRIVAKKKERLVFFNTAAQERLLRYINYERPEVKSLDEFLFLNYRHKAMTSRSIQRICVMFRSFLTGSNHLTPHTLRHSFASHLINQGTDVDIVQELLGFSTPVSTEKYTDL
jgi:site-specific recombinase XerD